VALVAVLLLVVGCTGSAAAEQARVGATSAERTKLERTIREQRARGDYATAAKTAAKLWEVTPRATTSAAVGEPGGDLAARLARIASLPAEARKELGEADRSDGRIRDHVRAARYADALALAEIQLATRERYLGPDDPDVGASRLWIELTGVLVDAPGLAPTEAARRMILDGDSARDVLRVVVLDRTAVLQPKGSDFRAASAPSDSFKSPQDMMAFVAKAVGDGVRAAQADLVCRDEQNLGVDRLDTSDPRRALALWRRAAAAHARQDYSRTVANIQAALQLEPGRTGYTPPSRATPEITAFFEQGPQSPQAISPAELLAQIKKKDPSVDWARLPKEARDAAWLFPVLCGAIRGAPAFDRIAAAALARDRRGLGAHDPTVALDAVTLALLRLTSTDLRDAASLAGEALAIRRARGEAVTAELAFDAATLGFALVAAGDGPGGRAMLDAARALYQVLDTPVSAGDSADAALQALDRARGSLDGLPAVDGVLAKAADSDFWLERRARLDPSLSSDAIARAVEAGPAQAQAMHEALHSPERAKQNDLAEQELSAADARTTEAVRLVSTGRLRDAAPILREQVEVYRRAREAGTLGFRNQAAVALLSLAWTHQVDNEFDQAVALYREVLELRPPADDLADPAILLALVRSSSSLRALGDLAGSREMLARAGAESAKTPVTDQDNDMRDGLRSIMAQQAKLIAGLKEAIRSGRPQDLKRAGTPPAPGGSASGARPEQRARDAARAGRLLEARELYDAALAEDTDDSAMGALIAPRKVELLRRAAEVDRAIGDYAAAETRLESARALLRKSDSRLHVLPAAIDVAQAELLVEWSAQRADATKLEQAERLLRASLASETKASKAGAARDAELARQATAITSAALARVLQARGDTDEVEALVRRSVEAARDALATNAVAEAKRQVLQDNAPARGLIAAEKGRGGRSVLDAITRAQLLASPATWSPEQAEEVLTTNMLDLASLLVRSEDPERLDEAEALLIEAGLMQRASLQADVTRAATAYGDFLRTRRGRPDLAIPLYLEAIEALEFWRLDVRGDEIRRSRALAEQLAVANPYAGLVRGRVAQNDPAGAYAELERGRSRALNDLLGRAGRSAADVAANVARDGRDADLDRRLQAAERTEEREKRRRDRLTARLRRLDAKEGPPTAARTRRREQIVAELAASSERTREASLVLFEGAKWEIATDTWATSSATPSRSVLRDDELLLAYDVGTESALLFVVRPDGSISVHELTWPDGSKLDDASLERALRIAASSDDPRPLPDAPTRARLGRALLPPDVVNQIRSAGRVVLVSGDALAQLPFETLPLGDGDGAPWIDAGPAIVQAPSAAVLASLRARATSPAGEAMVVALGAPAFPEVPSGTMQRAEAPPTGVDYLTADWSPLPRSKEEIDRIAALFAQQDGVQVTKLLGQDATLDRLERLVASPRYLHLATHGFALDGNLVQDSALVFPPVQRAQASLLRLKDLLSTWGGRLQGTELVVLSACETATGQRARGEGMIALTWGFLHAGARTVVATRWGIDDRAAALTMPRFYENLLGRFAEPRSVGSRTYAPGEAMPKAEALHEAKRWLRGLDVGAASRLLGTEEGASINRGLVFGRKPGVPSPGDGFPDADWSAFLLIGDG